jgi:Putative bacterial sensory transduction regulator
MPVRTASFVPVAAAALTLTASSVLAKPGTVFNVSRNSMAATLKSMGMDAQDTTEKDGTPWLTVKTKDSHTFNVFLYQCKNDADPRSPCEQIQFRIVWDNTNKRTLDDVNKFALEKVFGRGFMSEDKTDIRLEYPLHLTGGVSPANLRENINYFLRVVEDFEEIVKP